MEASSSVPASCPRVCLPIAHPDSPAPTYAVPQLVGCSDPSLRSPGVLTTTRSPPSPNWALRAAGDTSEAPHCAGSMDTTKVKTTGNSVGYSEADAGSMQENCSAESSSTGNPSPQSSSTRNFLCVDNHSPSGSCMDNSTCSSPIKGFDKKSVSVRPSLMKKTGGAGPKAASSGSKNCSKVGSTVGPISVSHTERDVIVHTDSSNFREVVHQLTGASGNDSNLLPVTLPSRTPAHRGNADDGSRGLGLSKQDPSVPCDYTGRSSEFRASKRMPAKLFERRWSSKTLERISTSCRDLPPLVPSPVTPLASDFERICLPVTPGASPTVVPAQDPRAMAHSTSGLQQKGNLQVCLNHNQPSMDMISNLCQSPFRTESLGCVSSEPLTVPCVGRDEEPAATFEDFVIAEKGFFLHPLLPRNKEPALLPLFPESPRDQQ